MGLGSERLSLKRGRRKRGLLLGHSFVLLWSTTLLQRHNGIGERASLSSTHTTVPFLKIYCFQLYGLYAI